MNGDSRSGVSRSGTYRAGRLSLLSIYYLKHALERLGDISGRVGFIISILIVMKIDFDLLRIQPHIVKLVPCASLTLILILTVLILLLIFGGLIWYYFIWRHREIDILKGVIERMVRDTTAAFALEPYIEDARILFFRWNLVGSIGNFIRLSILFLYSFLGILSLFYSNQTMMGKFLLLDSSMLLDSFLLFGIFVILEFIVVYHRYVISMTLSRFYAPHR